MKFRTIVVDPPWPFTYKTPSTRIGGAWGEKKRRPQKAKVDVGYPTMTVEEIAALDVGGLAEKDAHLYLWAVDRVLVDGTALAIIQGWGFTYKRSIVWRKRGLGLGSFPRPQHEVVMIATRGKLPFTAPNNIGSVQDWPHIYEKAGNSVAKVHSAKPEGFLDLVEMVSPGPRLELFARRNRLGWSTWGNQSLEHVEVAT